METKQVKQKHEKEWDGNELTIKRKKQNRGSEYFLTEEQIEKIVYEATNPRDRAMMKLFAYCGMRREEVRCLEIENIDFEYNKLHLVHTKGGKERTIPCRSDVINDLKLLIGKRQSGAIFLNAKGKKLSRKSINIIVANCGKRAGVTNPQPGNDVINPHLFRHSFARNFLRKNPGLYAELSMILGHSSVKITIDTYGQPSIADVGRAYENMWVKKEVE